ncbi:sortase [Peptoniphilus indolicus]|uniref:Sortase (Surface protein transpeptidase) n=1 Tax=Peptoniphilus indolicus TaxID=33030 RepID=A0A379DC34_9FIRM|nr:sortase [Peptoniphilus indolicus]SUB75141.1 Sortase (surface protein transpeptidase) [Peptoniphilus indolicus]
MRINEFKNKYFVIGYIFFFLAVLLIFYNIYEDYSAGEKSSEVINEIENKTNRYLDEADVYRNLNGIPMPTVKIGKYNYIGELSIEKLNTRLPVMEEWDYDRLKISPCRYSGSIYDKNMVIAGHNYKSHFGKLYTLNKGDRVEFLDVNKNIFNFEVINIEKLDPTNIELLINNENAEWDLTIFTCTLSGKERTVIRLKEIINGV